MFKCFFENAEAFVQNKDSEFTPGLGFWVFGVVFLLWFFGFFFAKIKFCMYVIV